MWFRKSSFGLTKDIGQTKSLDYIDNYNRIQNCLPDSQTSRIANL